MVSIQLAESYSSFPMNRPHADLYPMRREALILAPLPYKGWGWGLGLLAAWFMQLKTVVRSAYIGIFIYRSGVGTFRPLILL